ncbi:unnamed protein product [Amoebophrya sp. A120]|nr:unnamed protein product [Amoebophrya sp. A120]|eukprot:GSA120T00018332001.1
MTTTSDRGSELLPAGNVSCTTEVDGIPFSKLSMALGKVGRPGKSVMQQPRSLERALVAKWWGPISERLANEQDTVEDQNEIEEEEIVKLSGELIILEQEMTTFCGRLETELQLLKDLELQRIDLALYIQKTQAHSAIWFQSVATELDTHRNVLKASSVDRKAGTGSANNYYTTLGGPPFPPGNNRLQGGSGRRGNAGGSAGSGGNRRGRNGVDAVKHRGPYLVTAEALAPRQTGDRETDANTYRNRASSAVGEEVRRMSVGQVNRASMPAATLDCGSRALALTTFARRSSLRRQSRQEQQSGRRDSASTSRPLSSASRSSVQSTPSTQSKSAGRQDQEVLAEASAGGETTDREEHGVAPFGGTAGRAEPISDSSTENKQPGSPSTSPAASAIDPPLDQDKVKVTGELMQMDQSTRTSGIKHNPEPDRVDKNFSQQQPAVNTVKRSILKNSTTRDNFFVGAGGAAPPAASSQSLGARFRGARVSVVDEFSGKNDAEGMFFGTSQHGGVGGENGFSTSTTRSAPPAGTSNQNKHTVDVADVDFLVEDPMDHGQGRSENTTARDQLVPSRPITLLTSSGQEHEDELEEVIPSFSPHLPIKNVFRTAEEARLAAEETESLRLRQFEESVLKTTAARVKTQNLLTEEQETLQVALKEMDKLIASASKTLVRLREIRDVFQVCIREKKRKIKAREQALESRRRIYQPQVAQNPTSALIAA